MGGQPVAEGGIPVAESDFIFPVIAEETGLLGAAGVLLLYLCFAIRGIVTAARAKSDVSSFTAVGLTSIIVLQAFIIVGGVTRLIPLTGITLPFISQGGSSLIASFIIVGCLLRCGDEGTGVDSEMRQTGAIGAHGSDAVLGRVALGKRLTGTMIVFSVLFAVLVANLTYLMVIKAPEYQSMPVEQPHHRERGPHGAGHHLHCRRHGARHIGAPRGRLLQARIPRRRAGGSHRGLHLRALRHRRHRGRLQRHPARRAELRQLYRCGELARGHPDQGQRRRAFHRFPHPAGGARRAGPAR